MFLVESGGQKFVDDNYKSLARELDAKSPQTSYDVQELSKGGDRKLERRCAFKSN